MSSALNLICCPSVIYKITKFYWTPNEVLKLMERLKSRTEGYETTLKANYQQISSNINCSKQ